LPLLKNGRKLVVSFTTVDPQNSGSNLLALCHNHLCRNEIQDLDKNEQEPYYLNLLIKRGWKVTRLRITNNKAQAES
jgi:hypothetical protein